MPTAPARATSPKAPTRSRTPRLKDAVAMLKDDHKKVSALFEDFEKARSAGVKKRLVQAICQELTVHTRIEEEVFYPAFKAALKDKELVPEAQVEHDAIKDLIAQVQDAEPGSEVYDARVKVMGEFVRHHVKEEHNDMFPKARKSKLDLVALGQRMAQLKEALTQQRLH